MWPKNKDQRWYLFLVDNIFSINSKLCTPNSWSYLAKLLAANQVLFNVRDNRFIQSNFASPLTDAFYELFTRSIHGKTQIQIQHWGEGLQGCAAATVWHRAVWLAVFAVVLGLPTHWSKMKTPAINRLCLRHTVWPLTRSRRSAFRSSDDDSVNICVTSTFSPTFTILKKWHLTSPRCLPGLPFFFFIRVTCSWLLWLGCRLFF